MGTGQTRGFVTFGLVAALCVAAGPAFGFAPSPPHRSTTGAIKWSPTPERMLSMRRDHPAPRIDPRLPGLGLVVASWRSDGAPAVLWASVPSPNAIPMNPNAMRPVEPDRAGAHAVRIARALASAFNVDAEDLYVLDRRSLEGWTNVMVGQRHRGIDVRDAVAVFTYRDGVLTTVRNELAGGLDLSTQLERSARPDHSVDLAEASPIGRSAAQALALEAAREVAPSSSLVRGAELEVWLPSDVPSEARLAWTVRTRSTQPPTQLDLHVDATTAEILAVDDDVRWAEGEARVQILAERAAPGDPLVPFTVPWLTLESGGRADADGEVVGLGTVRFSYSSDLVRIRDRSGDALDRLSINPSGPYRAYEVRGADLTQADPFVHLSVVKAFAAQLTPSVRWVGSTLTANVNLNDACNAFWNGETVNFLRSGGGCNNTARIASIIYHEFGHGYHQALTRRVVGSIGEGSGDYLASTILSDPVVGRGFRTDGSGIRRIDRVRSFPQHYENEVHLDGLIWASALWSLRTSMIAKHGEVEGRRITDRLFVRALSTGPGLTTAYPAIISADDDDSNIGNGTPNSCEINEVFARHGMIDGGQIDHRRAPTRAFARVRHSAPGIFDASKGSVEIRAMVENASSCSSVDPSGLALYWTTGDQPWTAAPVSVSGGAATARIEGLEPGQLFRYYFEIQADGSTFGHGTEASPHLGRVDARYRELFVDDFEQGLDRWTHGVVGDDRQDDWQAGAPNGGAGGPTEARQGRFVAATDLGRGPRAGETDGVVDGGRTIFLQAPPIVTVGRSGIRVEFWEHVAVEGTRRLMLDGREVASAATNGEIGDKDGWRFVSIDLGEAAADNAEGMVLRFELETSSGNQLAGWAIDEVVVLGSDPINPTQPVPIGQAVLQVEVVEVVAPVSDTAEGRAVARPFPTIAGVDARPLIAGGCACVASNRDRHDIAFLLLVLLVLLSRRSGRLN